MASEPVQKRLPRGQYKKLYKCPRCGAVRHKCDMLRVAELEGILQAIRCECIDALARREEGDTLLAALLTVYQVAWAALERRTDEQP